MNRYLPTPSTVFEKYIKLGLLTKSELDNLVLFNYTKSATFERHWDEVTLNSRGTIYNKNTGDIEALAFGKFFNVNEQDSTLIKNLPWHLPFQVFEKEDGSMGVLYKHKGKYRVSTRGSFYSDQAVKATEMLSKYDLSHLPDNTTLIFEIIYPDNRIAVNYGDEEKLVVLGAFDVNYVNKTADVEAAELKWDKVVEIATACGFPLPKTYSYTLDDLLRLKEEIKWDECEGWVVRFHDGSRAKMKGTEYLEMAKIMSHMTPLAFWDAMMNGRGQEYLESIPEELKTNAESIYNTLCDQLSTLKSECEFEAERLQILSVDVSNKDLIKVKAKEIQGCPKWMHKYLFQVLRGKVSDPILIRILRPTENKYVDLNHLRK